jgi:hypothetical protein
MAKDETSQPEKPVGADQQQTENQNPSPTKIDHERKASCNCETTDAETEKKIIDYLPNRRDRIVRWTIRWAPLVTFFNLSLIAFTAMLVYVSNKQANIYDRQTRDNEAIQRAFVVFDGFTPIQVVDRTTKKVALWGFTPVWENSGTTPTQGMVSHVNRKLWDDSSRLPPDSFFSDIWDNNVATADRKNVPLVIGPKHTFNMIRLIVPIDWLIAAQEGKKQIYLYGWATYNDAFFPHTPGHITRFCYVLDKDSVLGDLTSTEITMRRVEPIVCAKYNCSDDECQNLKKRP